MSGLCEPFAGGAALSFAAGASRIHLGDTNVDLIDTYKEIRARPREVAASLAKLSLDKETYLDWRSRTPASRHERAVRTIFLNRTAFNGLWRVNMDGQFNVPFGCKPETRLPGREELIATSHVLGKSHLESGDFEAITQRTSAALIYLDPPYTVSHNNNGFVRYNEHIFSWSDQRRLARLCSALVADGRTVVVSNADHADLRSLYRNGPFKMYRVTRPSNLAAKADLRGRASELLIVSRNVRLRVLPPTAARVR